MKTVNHNLKNTINRRSLVASGAGAALAGSASLPRISHAKQSGPAEIRFLARTGIQGDYFQSQADAFHEAQDGVRVSLELTPDSEYNQKLTTLLAGGELADCWWAAPFYSGLYPFASRGVNMNLTDLAASSGVNLDDYFPGNIEQLTVDGELIAFPLGTHAGWSSLYVNTDAFVEAGVELPGFDSTYDGDWLEAMEGVTTDQRFGIHIPVMAQAAYTVIRSFGGNWIDPENRSVSLISSDESREALRFIHSLVHERGIAVPEEAVLPGDDYSTFANGIAASWMNGVWAVGSVEPAVEGKFTWATTSMPAGPDGGHGSFQGIDSICVNAETAQPEAVMEWIKWITSVDAGIAQLDAGLPPSSLMAAWDEEPMASDPHLAVTRQWLETIEAVTFPENARVSEFSTALNQNFQALMLSPENPDEAIDAMHEAVQAVLDQPGF